MKELKECAMEALIKYQIGTSVGEILITCNENDEDSYLIAQAKKIIRQRYGVSLPLDYESWKVVKRF